MKDIHEFILLGLLKDIQEGRTNYENEDNFISLMRSRLDVEGEEYHTLNLTVLSKEKETIDQWAKAIDLLQNNKWEEYYFDLKGHDQSPSDDLSGP